MSNPEFINYRKAVDETITRRLKFSAWFARGMFAVGLAGGAFAATGGTHNSVEFDSGFGAGVIASGAALFERRSARHQVADIIDEYAEDANVGGGGYLLTVLKVNNGELHEKTEIDRSLRSPLIASTTVGAVGAACVGSTITNIAFQGNALTGLATGVEVFGGLVVGMGAGMLFADHLSVSQDIQSSIRKLDNIDRSIRFED